ncbi:hypothetical protein ABZP36_027615 [Zizania latifolia]
MGDPGGEDDRRWRRSAQFKALVEYAPSQQVLKSNTKKDVRQGTIMKDPEYLEFLESISKPAEHLQSAEIQLERKEAERAAAGKEPPIVTPLMVFVRQQRAAKSMARRSGGSRPNRKASGVVTNISNHSKRASEKRKTSTSTKAAGLTINQQLKPLSSFDMYLQVLLSISAKSQSATLNVRIPSWTSANGAKATLNDKDLGLISPGCEFQVFAVALEDMDSITFGARSTVLPRNVLVSKERPLRAKLSDMGISKRLQEDMTSLSHHGTGFGGFGWQAREQLRHGR